MLLLRRIASLLFITLIVNSLSSVALAQGAKPQQRRSRIQQYLASPYFQLDGSYKFWNEPIAAKTDTTQGELSSYFQGWQMQFSYLSPRPSLTWGLSYTGIFSAGKAKASGASTGINSFIDNQLWLSAGFAPGVFYRSSLRSEFALRIPILVRQLLWEFNPSMPLELVEPTSFSAGITGIYIQKFNLRSALSISLTYHQGWETTSWSIGYQYDLR